MPPKGVFIGTRNINRAGGTGADGIVVGVNDHTIHGDARTQESGEFGQTVSKLAPNYTGIRQFAPIDGADEAGSLQFRVEHRLADAIDQALPDNLRAGGHVAEHNLAIGELQASAARGGDQSQETFRFRAQRGLKDRQQFAMAHCANQSDVNFTGVGVI